MNAVVTGGTRGIGRGIAEELLKNGFSVLVTSRNENGFDEMKSLYGDRVCFYPCDVSDVKSIEALVSFAEEKFGSVEVLVNNAGVAPR